MGNRLIYGNYTEGYNLIDKDGLALNLDYTVEVNSKNIGGDSLTASNAVAYTYQAFGFSQANANSGVKFDLGGFESSLVTGATLSFSLTYEHLLYQLSYNLPYSYHI